MSAKFYSDGHRIGQEELSLYGTEIINSIYTLSDNG